MGPGRSPGSIPIRSPASGDPTSLSLAEARALRSYLASLDARQREALGLPADRADSVTPAACIAAELIALVGQDAMSLIDSNVRDGILADLAADATRAGVLPV